MITKTKFYLFTSLLIATLIISCSKHDAFSIVGPNESVYSIFAGQLSASGTQNGQGTNSSFNAPTGLAFDSQNNLYVTDKENHLIRKITPNREVTTFAGSGTAGNLNGNSNSVQFNQPEGLTIDSSNNLYIADTGNHLIRKITTNGTVTTFAGSGIGSTDGTGISAQFNAPRGLAIDQSNNIYVADSGNNLIRKITPSRVVTTFAGNTAQFNNFNQPSAVIVDKSGNIYVSDTGNHLIRKFTASGIFTNTIGSIVGSANGIGTNAQFNQPRGIAIDANQNIYVVDNMNQTIRLITPNNQVSIFAGSDNYHGTLIRFNQPQSLAINGNYLYVSDSNNHVIKRIVIAPSYTLTKKRGRKNKDKIIVVPPTQTLFLFSEIRSPNFITYRSIPVFLCMEFQVFCIFF